MDEIELKNEEVDKEREAKVHEELLQALKNKDEVKIKDLAEQAHPIDLAIAMEDFEDEDISYFASLLSDELLAEIIEQADEDLQNHIMKIMQITRIMQIFQYMSKDNIVDILGNMPADRRKDVVNLMKTGDQKIIRNLLGYEENTAGGIMTTEYISVRNTLTVSQALATVKDIAPKTEEINTIYVLNEKKQLVGTVSIRELLVAKNGDIINDIMEDNVISVEPETDQEEVARLVSKYDLHAIPVVNKRKGLLGIITVDDIIDVIEEENTEDMLKLGGVSKEENVDSTLWDSIKMRLPWLLINLLTAFLAAATVSLFEDTIQQVVALAAAMPIVAGMGGNAGTQTLAIVVRGIALGDIEWRGNKLRILKEIFVGVLNGAVTGLVAGAVIYWMYGNLYLGIIIFVAMIANLVIAGFFGFLVPVVLKALNADPAVASSIFITTATDVFGFFVFLGLAKTFLPYLLK
ncbi:MAG: magnesium transporter [Acidaminococcaceae bacterium]|nr:magnesium transporter [Acidaminococcaceae bacterium]MCI2110282.1 magnesium transporter [Acidaminococcaceae bacterium]